MSGTLDPTEVSIIKTMLTLNPKLNNQKILAYFTRPGRDINHARITEIIRGDIGHGVSAAPWPMTLAYMMACEGLTYPEAAHFSHQGAPAPATRQKFAMLELTCWPVGQGLFASGRLAGASGGFFRWVYDCGSSSDAKVHSKAIDGFRSTNPGRVVDLVTLSHFDKDHINGIEALLKETRIGTLLLPYIPLWQRLLIAISEDVALGTPLFQFFIDPAAYLTERGEIEEIVFVPPSGPDDIVSGEGEVPDPDVPIDGAKAEAGDPPDGAEDDPALSGPASARVRFLRPAGRIVIPSWWEFVPYNDAQLQPRADPRFISRASRIARVFVANEARRADALQVLKAIYKQTFGADSKSANLISLFLYSGPIGTRLKLEHSLASCAVRWNDSGDNFAQLWTGDGYLDTPARLDALRRFYGRNRRFERAGVLQVMHHGARGNWHEGLAAALNPAVSIFSSDPNHKGLSHPHAEVLRDFWLNCPTQVDQKNSFGLLAILALP